MKIVPFFVADRPMSLRLLKTLPLQNYPDVRIGIMAHANTTLNFQRIFHDYPCDDFNECDAVGGPCQFKEDITRCPVRQHILSHTIKMCDSGIFTREGAMLTYQQLFEVFVRMGVEYGVMIDVFRDPLATLESAKEALRAFEPFAGQFKLVGVAQGKTAEEYIQNYEDLKKLGFSYIAIGGLLRKVEKSARYAQVRSEETMYSVLRELRERYPNDWLFALGCFHPSRLDKFQELNVWGDYKGWIFQYEKRNETLNEQFEAFSSNHLQHVENVNSPQIAKLISALQKKVKRRNAFLLKQKDLSRQIFEYRRTLKTSLASLYQEIQVHAPEMASISKALISRGLLDDGEERQVVSMLKRLRIYESEKGQNILYNIQKNRELKNQIGELEQQLNAMNISLAKDIAKLRSSEVVFSEDSEEFFDHITAVVEDTERSHRFEQVRSKIVEKILSLL
jgi:hypothetical protein